MKGAAAVRSLVRFLAAIIVASVVGEIVAIPAAFFIDIVVGANVTGGRWPLNAENVVLVCFKGLVIGCIAGSIARKLGSLAGALDDAIGAVDCVLEKTIDHFATTVAIGRVVDVVARGSGDPLIYFRGGFLND